MSAVQVLEAVQNHCDSEQRWRLRHGVEVERLEVEVLAGVKENLVLEGFEVENWNSENRLFEKLKVGKPEVEREAGAVEA